MIYTDFNSSDWYIYDIFGVTVKRKEDEELVILHYTNRRNTYCYSYDLVKKMYETGNWSALQCDMITQPEVLMKCACQWLEEVDKRYEAFKQIEKIISAIAKAGSVSARSFANSLSLLSL